MPTDPIIIIMDPPCPSECLACHTSCNIKSGQFALHAQNTHTTRTIKVADNHLLGKQHASHFDFAGALALVAVAVVRFF